MKLILVNNRTPYPYQLKGVTKEIRRLCTLSFTVSYQNAEEMEEEIKNLKRIGVINILPYPKYFFMDFTIPEGLGFIIKED